MCNRLFTYDLQIENKFKNYIFKEEIARVVINKEISNFQHVQQIENLIKEAFSKKKKNGK